MTQIKKHIDSVTALLILANGTVPPTTAGSDYALSTLSAIFPESLASNTAFMFTHVSSPPHWSFSRDAVTEVLRDAPQFLLDNPVPLQKKSSKPKGGPNMKKGRAPEGNALEMLVDLFDWLDGLEPHPMAGIVSLYDDSQAIEAKVKDVLGQMDQAATVRAKIEGQMEKLQRASTVSFSVCFHLCSNHMLNGQRTWRDAPANPEARSYGSSDKPPTPIIFAT